MKRTAALVAAMLLTVTGCGTTTGGSGTASSASASASASASGVDTSSGASTTVPASAPATSGARFDDQSEVSAVLAHARADVEAINSYDYRHLARAKASATAHATPSYARIYLAAFRLIAQQAPNRRAVQTASVTQAGIGSVDGDTAVALVLGQLTIVTKDSPAAGRIDPFTVRVTLLRTGSNWLIDRLGVDGTIEGDPPGNAALVAAAQSTRRGVTALLSYRRAHFDADFARAVASTTGGLRRDLASKKSVTKQELTKGGFDLSATVHSIAAASAAGDTAVFLVRVDGQKVIGGRAGTSTPQSLRVTVAKVGSEWLLSDVQSVGTS